MSNTIRMSEANSLREAIKTAAQSWPHVVVGDPNPIDIYWHSKEVVRLLGLQLPAKLPEIEIGVALVECVETKFIIPEEKKLIRECSAQILAERSQKLLEDVQGKRLLLSVELPESYAIALYTWYGCINMAKILRETYVIQGGEESYTNEMRQQGYAQLQKCWRDENNRGNPWVRYGVSLAMPLERKRGNQIVDDWISEDSPYWR